MLDAADAYIDKRLGEFAHNVSLDAENVAQIDATASSTIEAWDATSVVLAFNSIGWKPSNILFNAVDALIGDPLISGAFNGEQPAEAQAYLQDVYGQRDRRSFAHREFQGAARRRGRQREHRRRRRRLPVQHQTRRPEGHLRRQEQLRRGAWSTATARPARPSGGLITSNKVDSFARAFITFTGAAQGAVTVTGAVTISAADQTGIDAHSSVVQDVTTTNTLTGLRRPRRRDDRQERLQVHDRVGDADAGTTATSVRVGPTYGGRRRHRQHLRVRRYGRDAQPRSPELRDRHDGLEEARRRRV